MALPKKVIVEMFAHYQRLSWVFRIRDAVESRILRQPACYLQRSNASTMLAALTSHHTFLQWDALVDISAICRLVGWNIASDLAASCFRLKFKAAEQAVHHNNTLAKHRRSGIIIVVDSGCLGHIVDGETKSHFQKQLLCPKLRATAFCATLLGASVAISSALWRIVQEDLRFGFPHAHSPASVGRQHTRVLIQVTLES